MPVMLKNLHTSIVFAGTAKSMRLMSKAFALIVNGLPIMAPSRLNERIVAPAAATTAGAAGRLAGGAAIALACLGKETRNFIAVTSDAASAGPMPLPNPMPPTAVAAVAA